MTTAAARVKANSRNSEPIRPGIRPIGAKTAATVAVVATMAKPISRDPMKAASTGCRPSRMCRWTFSTSTMASSTTSPTASTMASKEKVFRL